MKKNLLLIFFLTITWGITYAQERTVSGKITDETGAGLPGANIMVKGTTRGQITNADGQFTIEVSPDAILQISSIGYATQEIPVGNQTTINTQLKIDVTELNEVVVTGYFTEQKKDIIGSVSVVKTDELLQTPSGNVTNQLQGRASGVIVTSSGTPGAAAKVRIRGFGTLSGGANPLYIIDGVPVTDDNATATNSPAAINSLNPNDIESMQVLKDAAAASIYGSRAAGGVIIITTKKGVAGSAKVTVDSYYGASYVSSKDFPDLLSTEEMGQLLWTQQLNATGTTPTNAQYGSGPNPVVPEYILAGGFSGAQLEAMKVSNPTAYANAINPANYDFVTNPIIKSADTDWFDEVFNPAPIRNIQLGVSGGSDKGSYSLSFNNFSQDNTANKFGHYNRYTTRANTSFKVGAIRIGENLQVSYTNSTGTGVSAPWNMQPLVPVYDIMGNPASTRAASTGNGSNPISGNMRNKDDSNTNFGIFGNAYADVTLLKNFVVRTSFGIDYGSNDVWDYTQRTYEHAQNTTQNSLSRTMNQNTSWTWTNTITYNKTFGKQVVKVLAGTEAIRRYSDDVTGSVQDYPDNVIGNTDFVTLSTGSGVQSVSGGFTRESLASLFGRVDYTFADKYLINATVRRDGSSKFGINNRYGVFPAVGVAWRLSGEEFMKGIEWLNDLKVRGSYGVIGNQNGLSAANQYSTYNRRPQDGYPLGNSNAVTPGFTPARLGNPDARWERNITTNIGVDATLFNNSLDVTFEYFIKNTEDLLVQNQASYTGTTATQPSVNIGSMVNKGIDFNITKRGSIIPGLTYAATVNFTHYKNEVKKVLDNDDSFLIGVNETSGMGVITRTQKGFPVSYIWGYEIDGFFQTPAEAAEYSAANSSWITARYGGWRIKDTNGDHIVDEKDRTQIGSPHPDFQVGFNLSLGYKNFDLTGFLFWNQGGQVINSSRRDTDFNRFIFVRSARMLYESWTPENPDARLPRLSSTDSQSPQYPTTYFVEDMTFVRMKTLQLGYTFPQSLVSKLRISKLRVYVQAQNLFTAVGGKNPFSGLDPDAALSGNQDTQMGVVNSQNPTPKQIIGGISLGF